MYLNGKSYSKVFLTHSDIMEGGQVDFTMTPYPQPMEYSEDDLPYSVSKS